MKKLMTALLSLLMVVTLFGCGKQDSSSNNMDTLSTQTVAKLFKVMNDSMNEYMVEEIDGEMVGWLIGADEFTCEVKEVTALVPMMNIDPFVLLVAKTEDSASAEELAKSMKESAQLNKWVCVSADVCDAKVSGSTVLFFMSTEEYKDVILNTFDQINAKGFNVDEVLVDPIKKMSMEDLYNELYNAFAGELFDGADLITLADVTGYGLDQVDFSNVIDSVVDYCHKDANSEEEEKAYFAVFARVAEGASAETLSNELKNAFDGSSVSMGTCDKIVAYKDDVVVFFAGSGNYAISATVLGYMMERDYEFTVNF